MKNILFVIEGKDKKKIKVLESKLKSIIGSNDNLVIEPTTHQLYYNYAVLGTEEFVCLLNEDMTINDNFLSIIKEYDLSSENTIYLPLVVLDNNKAKGVLNNCIWNLNLAEEVGYLDHKLALKQLDLTLYGAVIPSDSFFNEEFYNKELEYYQHFYFLNKFTSKEGNLVVGIPKTLYSTSIDLSFDGIENDIKIKNFKLASNMQIPSKLSIV